MITQSPTPAATVSVAAVTVPRVRSILALAVLSFAIFTASAQAHTGTATATCNSVTFNGRSSLRPAAPDCNTPTGRSCSPRRAARPSTIERHQRRFPGTTFTR